MLTRQTISVLPKENIACVANASIFKHNPINIYSYWCLHTRQTISLEIKSDHCSTKYLSLQNFNSICIWEKSINIFLKLIQLFKIKISAFFNLSDTNVSLNINIVCRCKLHDILICSPQIYNEPLQWFFSCRSIQRNCCRQISPD